MRLGFDAAGASADEEWGPAERVATVTATRGESSVTVAQLIVVPARAGDVIPSLLLPGTPLRTITILSFPSGLDDVNTYVAATVSPRNFSCLEVTDRHVHILICIYKCE